MITAFDTETHLIEPGLLAPPIVCLQWQDEGTSPAILHRAHARPVIEGWLQADNVLVGHNVAYDMGVIAAQWPDLMPAIFRKYDRDEVTDTKIRDQVLQIAKGEYRSYLGSDGEFHAINYTLEALTRRHCGVQLEKDIWRLRYSEFDNEPDTSKWPQGARDYALSDAFYTLACYQRQEELAASTGRPLFSDQFRQARAAFALHLSSCWGLHTDPEAVETVAAGLEAECAELVADLCRAGIVRPDGTADTKAAMALMEKECLAEGLPIGRTKGGAVSLSSEACDRFPEESIMGQYSRFLKVRKTLANDIAMLRKGCDVPIQPRYDIADTFRTTCSGPNIQAVNRGAGIRECFIPREGCVFIAADYSALELHTRAVWCLERVGFSRLAERLNAGIDVHSEMASKMLHMSYDDVKAGIKAKDKTCRDARQAAKAINFGYPGGLGAAKFVAYAKNSYGVTITEAEAHRFKAMWLESDPEMVEYFRMASALVAGGDTGEEEALFVSRWRRSRYTSLCNGRFQGLGADAAKEALWRVTRACYTEPASPLYGSHVVAFVHDEIIVEIVEGVAHEGLIELERLMTEGANMYLHRVPVHTEGVCMRRWSKKAELAYGLDGRVIPWDKKAEGSP